LDFRPSVVSVENLENGYKRRKGLFRLYFV